MARARMIVALILTYMLFGILLNSVGTVILQSVTSLEQTKIDAAILEAYKDLPIAVTSFLVASILPRLGLRNAMIFGTSIVAVALLTMPVFQNFTTAKLMFAAVGVSFALVKVSVYASIALLTNDRAGHASMTNLIEALFMVGVLSGYWLFGAFIDPINPKSLSWLNVYWLLSALAGAVILLLVTSRLDERAAALPPRRGFEDLIAMLALLGRPLVSVFVMSAFIYVLIEQAVGTWLPTFNNEVLHLPAAMSVQAASIFAAALALGRFAAAAALTRIGWYPLLNLCVVVMAILVLVSLPLTRGITIDPTVGWLTAPLPVYILPMIGLFLAPIYPVINSVMLTALPKPDHAAATGLLVVFSALGGTTGSFITGQVFARFDGQTAFYMALLPMAILLIALAAFRRYSEDR
jgi:MFS transporter, FHS family, glucose/mannose:H+ symporter